MTIPEDIECLSTLFPKLGIDAEIAEKARVLLCADPRDQNRWGGIAVDFRDAGKYYAADAVLAAALHRFPDSTALWGARADLFRRWEKVDGAEAFFLHAIELDPNAPSPLFGLALLYEQIELYTEAIQWYHKFLEMRPESASAHTNLANCYRQLHRSDDACRHYKMALSVNPNHANALFNFASILYEQRKFDHALRLIDTLLTRHPSDDGAQLLRKEILRRPDKPQKIGKQQLVNRPIIIRGSPNYGWQGPASSPVMSWVEPDTSFTEILTHAELLKHNVDERRAFAGYRTSDIAELEREISQIVSSEPVPRPSECPIVFVSYRWSSPDHKKWVTRFALQLISNGYKVNLDRFMSQASPDLSVPKLVASIARCNVFIPIFTDDYSIAVEPNGMFTEEFIAIGIDEDAWVFDEYRVAKQLISIGRMQYFPLWRSGTMLPSPFYEGNVVDVRTEDKYRQAIRTYLPSITIGADK